MSPSLLPSFSFTNYVSFQEVFFLFLILHDEGKNVYDLCSILSKRGKDHLKDQHDIAREESLVSHEKRQFIMTNDGDDAESPGASAFSVSTLHPQYRES